MLEQNPASHPAAKGRIVNEVFSRPDRARPHRWKVAIATTAGIYAVVFGALPFFAAPSLQEWASALAARVHAELDRDREVAIETPPPPPPRPDPPPPAARPTAPPVARAAPRVARARSAAPPAPATAAPIVAASGPVDLTDTTFVTGNAATYAGGATTSSGTNKNAVETRTVDPKGSATPAAARGRPVRLDPANWSCSWPADAYTAEINQQVVVIRVAVKPDGSATTVKIISDPGSGFAQQATKCALQARFEPAQDERGKEVVAWSPPIRVWFYR